MEKTIVTRTPYMQRLMTSTYHMVAVEAIKSGFDGAWERLIARKLRDDYLQEKEAGDLIHSFDDQLNLSFFECCLKAAYLITSSKTPECHI